MSAPPEDMAAIKMTPEPDFVGTAPGVPAVVIQAGDKLFALDEEVIVAAAGFAGEMNLLEDPRSRLLAEGVEGQWTIDAYRRCVIVPRKGAVDLAMLDKPKEGAKEMGLRRLEFANLRQPVASAIFGGTSSALLAVTLDTRDPGFLYHDAWLIDGPTKRVTALPVKHSVRPFEASWLAPRNEFVVFDPSAEQLLLVPPEGPLGKIQVLAKSMAGAYTITGVAVHPKGEVLSAAFETPSGRMGLLTAYVMPDGVTFNPPVELPRGSYNHLRWNPKHRLLLAERHVKVGTAWTLLQGSGQTVHELVLPRGWASRSVAWSGDGKLVLAARAGYLAAWRVLAHRLLSA